MRGRARRAAATPRAALARNAAVSARASCSAVRRGDARDGRRFWNALRGDRRRRRRGPAVRDFVFPPRAERLRGAQARAVARGGDGVFERKRERKRAETHGGASKVARRDAVAGARRLEIVARRRLGRRRRRAGGCGGAGAEEETAFTRS